MTLRSLCVEALGILFSALSSDDTEYRDPRLQAARRPGDVDSLAAGTDNRSADRRHEAP